MSSPEASLVRLISRPARRFQEDSYDILNFITVTIDHTTQLEYMARTMASSILELPADQLSQFPPNIRESASDLVTGKQHGPIHDLMRHWPLQFELLFSRSVDNFLSYISELLALIFTTLPLMLMSDSKITVSWALQFADRDELLAALTERKVIELSFKGMLELQQELVQKYDFSLFDDEDELKRAAILIEKRNLIAHNRAEVNRRYQERVPEPPTTLGERLQFEPTEVMEDLFFLLGSVIRIDEQAHDKFDIVRDEQALIFPPARKDLRLPEASSVDISDLY